MPRILIVEDNEENWDMLSRRLGRRGFDVAVAVDGRQAVETARAGAFDLILMDIDLPEMDGWEVMRHLRADPVTAAVPVIALTAHAMAGDREKALEAGCAEHHPKPVDLALLLEQIEASLPGPGPDAAGG